MIEIYNEAIFDLLSPGQAQCQIREDIKNGVHLEGQVEEHAYSGPPLLKCHLLSPVMFSAAARIRKHGAHPGQFERLRMLCYWTFAVLDIVKLLMRGTKQRHVGETSMNRESSRSHCVFTCTLESRVTEEGITSIRHSRLNLVDLAGKHG